MLQTLSKKTSPDNQPKMSVAKAAEFLNMSVQGVHRQLKAKNITCPKIGNKAYLTHSIARQLFNIIFVKTKIAVEIVKGGTGKTTTVHNMSACASTYGARVLVVDLDPQGNLTDSFKIDPEHIPILIDFISGEAEVEEGIINVADGIDLIPSRIENVTLNNKIMLDKLPLHTLFSDLLDPVVGNYDFVIFDCPPNLDCSVTAASLYVDRVIAPLNPDKYSAKGLKILKKEIENIKRFYKKDIQYRVFLNKYSERMLLSNEALIKFVNDEDIKGHSLGTSVRQCQEIPNTTAEDKNLFVSLKESIAKADIDELTREILEISCNRDDALKINSKQDTRFEVLA